LDEAAEMDADCAAWLGEVCEGQKVGLSFPHRPRRDDQQRWGAWVYLETGEMLNEVALEEGYARREALGFDVEMDGWLERLENRARYDDRGVWGRR
jgi:endonuclease YncB( thermonuclease family)